MSTTTRAAYILLALDAGAVWAVALTLAVVWRRHRRALAATRAADAASAPTSPWTAALYAPTAPLPTVAATDPWAGCDTPPAPVPVSPAPTVAAEVRPTWSTGPTAALPRFERRRVIQHRNAAPAAAEPPTGRYVELVLTRR